MGAKVVNASYQLDFWRCRPTQQRTATRHARNPALALLALVGRANS
jgi:hypothetical protein